MLLNGLASCGGGEEDRGDMSSSYCRIITKRLEPEFLNILKCNLAESARTGFQFYCYDIFNDKTLNYRHLDYFFRSV